MTGMLSDVLTYQTKNVYRPLSSIHYYGPFYFALYASRFSRSLDAARTEYGLTDAAPTPISRCVVLLFSFARRFLVNVSFLRTRISIISRHLSYCQTNRIPEFWGPCVYFVKFACIFYHIHILQCAKSVLQCADKTMCIKWSEFVFCFVFKSQFWFVDYTFVRIGIRSSK